MLSKKNINNSISLAAFGLLLVLFIFLPFSSWLVSVTGKVWLSMTRDVLVLLIFSLTVLQIILSRKFKLNQIIVLSSLFVLYGFFSVFWREASILQWLRGFRFTFVPIILFIVVSSLAISDSRKKILLKVVLGIGIIVAAVAVFEAIGLKLPLSSRFSGEYAMEPSQFLQGTQIKRLQSILAGPNALGLYLLGLVAYALGAFRSIAKWPIWLVLPFSVLVFFTFSRSSFLGLLIIAILAGFIYSKKKSGIHKTYTWSASLLLLIAFLGYYFVNIQGLEKYITHGTSSKLRYEQVLRLWDERNEIGFLGKGSGTAGPSSQNRLDGGPNNWSENIFLETFEELGIIGLLFIVLLYIMLLKKGWAGYNSELGRTAFLITAGFGLSGLFINNYTGQVGIYLFFLANGLLLGSKEIKLNKL